MRVLIADWQAVRRFGLRLALSAAEDVDVVGEADTADEAFRAVREARPEVVILNPDIEREGGSTIGLCLAIKLPAAGGEDAPRVLLFGGSEDIPGDEGIVDFYAFSGADSFVEAGEEAEVLLEALRRTHAGERVFLPGTGG